MRKIVVVCLSVCLSLALGVTAARAQSQTDVTASVPRLINITGGFQPAGGQPIPARVVVILAIYNEATGGMLLWQETQTVTLDKAGRFSLLLGATRSDGIPRDVLAASDEQWLGLQFPGEAERPRTRLTSVPYALRSADADTLGGRPASAYVLAPSTDSGRDSQTTGSTTPSTAKTAAAGSHNQSASTGTTNAVLNGTPNMLAKYVSGVDVGNSAIYENNGLVGIGTTAPADSLHVRFTNTIGSVTGYAVQNMGSTATSFSGMLFYDQNGMLGQFQGFSNGTHEYRINNIASLGSINFMIGGSSRFFASPVGVGIGTTSPSPTANLDISNAVSGSGTTNVNVTTYSANGFGPNLIGKKARGTQGAPTAVLNNDALLDLSANGYGATGFAGVNSANISMRANENWTDTAQGSIINLSTTANGTTTPITRMTVGSNGNVGIGVFGAQANLEVSNASSTTPFGTILGSSFTGSTAAGTLFVGRKARGTAAAPTTVQNNDNLAAFLGRGFGSTTFGGTIGGMFVQAAENFTDAAQGTRLSFHTTAIGTVAPGPKMTIDPAGNVGIGTVFPQGALEVSRTGVDVPVMATAYGNGTGASAFFIAQTARGTAAAPTAVQAGDLLGGFGASGFGTTSFNDIFAAVVGAAAENFTDTARGSTLLFGTTPLGTQDINIVMGLLPSGNAGIGTPLDANGLPTATDKLQVFGDVRVGTTGTNGCLKNFGGGTIAGTCSSDRRFKRNITPFGPALDKVAALQPVHYYWRTDEFPQRHFGDTQTYGLIAQDVEQVLPELVVTNDDGYKAIDYSKLPLLTIQAVKELKEENDALKARNDELASRLAAVERLIGEMQTARTRQ